MVRIYNSFKQAEEESLEIMTQQSMRQVRWVSRKEDFVTKELNKKLDKLYKEEEALVTKDFTR